MPPLDAQKCWRGSRMFPTLGLWGHRPKKPYPTNIEACGDFLLISLLSGGPLAPYHARVMAVSPITGENYTFIANLNAAIDVECAARPAPNNPTFFVLEYSVNQGATPLPLVV